MVGAEARGTKLDRAARKRLARFEVAPRVRQPAEVVKQRRDVGAFRIGGLDDWQRAAIDPFCFVVASEEFADDADLVQGIRHCEIAAAEVLLRHREGVAGGGIGPIEVPCHSAGGGERQAAGKREPDQLFAGFAVDVGWHEGLQQRERAFCGRNGFARSIHQGEDARVLDQGVGEVRLFAGARLREEHNRLGAHALGGFVFGLLAERDRALVQVSRSLCRVVGHLSSLRDVWPRLNLSVRVLTGYSRKMSPHARRSARRWLAPEVIQTSAMDCGPAALKCLLAGFGISVSYGRLREACQTSVDGTSIDTLESVAGLLGLEAEQILVPAEHVPLPEADVLPALAVIVLPSGMTHFVVLWRRVGRYLQVMDPARGRRWVKADDLVRELYVHSTAVDTEAFAAFVADPGFTGPLRARIARLGGARRLAAKTGRRRGALLELVDGLLGSAEAAAGEKPPAESEPSLGEGQRNVQVWQRVARVDGAVRAVEKLVAGGAIQTGDDALAVLDALSREVVNPSAVPDVAAMRLVDEQACGRVAAVAFAATSPEGARPAEAAAPATAAPTPEGDDAGQVAVKGAVLLRVIGVRPHAETELRPEVGSETALPPELAAALEERARPVWATLFDLIGRRGRQVAAVLLAGALVIALGAVAEVLAARPLLSAAPHGMANSAGAEAWRNVASTRAALAVLAAVVSVLMLIEMPLVHGARALGRGLDIALRRSFLAKLPRLGDRYFSSRPVSDMAERAHLLHRTRLLPPLAVQIARTVAELALFTAAIGWLYPRGLPIAFGLFVVGLALPVGAAGALAERDLRVRTHAGALTRFYLDALLGLSAVRTHRAESAITVEHDGRLAEWRRAGASLVRAISVTEMLVLGAAAAGAAALVGGYLSDLAAASSAGRSPAPAATALLLLFFALALPSEMALLMALLRQVPEHRNLTVRLVEPLGAPEEWAASPSAEPAARSPSASPGGVSVRFDRVTLEISGRPVLREISAEIGAGTHIALVGASGAGKSSLLAVALGLHRPAHGAILVDGRPPSRASVDLDGEVSPVAVPTAWLDPAVQLWNRSLIDNVTFGCRTVPPPEAVARALEEADVSALARRIALGAAGTGTFLGEGGGLLSGGEGQRVRFARELLRVPDARLVIFDEPFRGLDRDARRRLLETARSRWRGATMLVATHDLEATTGFDRVLVIEDGQIVEDAAPATLAADPTSRYWRLIEAERQVSQQRWASMIWTRVDVRDGRVSARTP